MDKKVLNRIGNLIKYENGQGFIDGNDLEQFDFCINDYMNLLEILEKNNIAVRGIYVINDDILDLLRDYQKCKNKKNRDILFDKLKYIIYNCAYKYSKTYNINAEELVFYAYEGFIYAIDTYDFTSSPFRKYLFVSIRHILLKEIRNNSDITRSIYFDFNNAKKLTEEKLDKTLEQDVTIIDEIIKEMAQMYNYSDTELQNMKNRYLISEGIVPYSTITDDEDIEKLVIRRLMINQELSRCRKTKSDILKLRYDYGYFYDDIAEILGITKQGVNVSIKSFINDKNVKRRLKDI